MSREGGKAVSAYACNPRRALANGAQAATIGQTGDVMTDPEWRGKGLFSGLDRRAMEATAEAGWPAVFGLPNRKSEKLFTEKLGWSSVGRIRPWTFVLVNDRRARRERHRAGRLALLGTPWAFWSGRRTRRRLGAAMERGLSWAPIERFSDDVDELWRHVAPRFRWMVQRDASYLNWRFLDAPSGRFEALGVRDPEGRIRAYAVIQNPGEGQPVGYVVDMLALDGEAAGLAMAAALERLAERGAAVARAWAIDGSSWSARLQDFGFRAPKAADFKVVIAMVHDPDHPLGRAAMEPSSWYFTDGDRDDELVS